MKLKKKKQSGAGKDEQAENKSIWGRFWMSWVKELLILKEKLLI